MTIRAEVRESLKQQDICPSCGTSWKELEDSLHEGLDSPNCYLALLIIRGCPTSCRVRFESEYNRLVSK